MDYAKIANIVDIREDLSELIVNYNYPLKKSIQNLQRYQQPLVLAQRLHPMLLYILMVLNTPLKVTF